MAKKTQAKSILDWLLWLTSSYLLVHKPIFQPTLHMNNIEQETRFAVTVKKNQD